MEFSKLNFNFFWRSLNVLEGAGKVQVIKATLYYYNIAINLESQVVISKLQLLK